MATANSRHASTSRLGPKAVWYRACRSLPREYMPSAMLSGTLAVWTGAEKRGDLSRPPFWT